MILAPRWSSQFLSFPAINTHLSLEFSLPNSLKMQSTAISFSPSISLPSKNRHNLLSLSPSRLPLRFGSANGINTTAPRILNSVRCSSSSSKLNGSGWISDPLPVPERESSGVTVRATSSEPESSAGEEEAPKSKPLADTLVLGSLFGLWYIFNIYFNIYNKQVCLFSHFPFFSVHVLICITAIVCTFNFELLVSS